MPDLLAHVLVVYACGTVLTWYSDRVPRRFVPIAMAGTGIPDLSKLRVVLDADAVQTLLGVPFVWGGMHRLGPALLVAGVTTLAFRHSHQRRVFGALASGILLHLVLDLGVIRAAGVAPPYLYPVTWRQPPSLNLFLSSQLWPTVGALSLATVVLLLDRLRGGDTEA